MQAASAPYVSLFRPLFTTAFLIDDFLAECDFFQARAVLISSASSKTSMGPAYCLKQRRAGRPEIVGLTSTRNAAFVAGLGTYDRVVTYDGIGGLRAPQGAVVVDLAGGETTLRAIHTQLGDELKYSCRVRVDAMARRNAGDREFAGGATGGLLRPGSHQGTLVGLGARGLRETGRGHVGGVRCGCPALAQG